MKKYITFFLITFCMIAQGQVGKKIITKYFTSWYDSVNAQPTLVIYKLYKAPMKSENSRASMRFHRDSLCNITASNLDYVGSGYDIGHMCDAEDMSFSAEAEESTFRFYNATPQTPANNRGTWKKYENFTRKCSQEDSILVLCGPIIESGLSKIKEGSSLTVPNRDYKVVQSLSASSKFYLVCIIDQKGNYSETTIQDLEKLIGFDIEKYLKK